jgi:hypothetical protein
MEIAVRAHRIVVQSAAGGVAMSLLAMIAAALLGWLPPAGGALLEEGIDVAVILNALRALLPTRGARTAPEPDGRGPHPPLRDRTGRPPGRPGRHP